MTEERAITHTLITIEGIKRLPLEKTPMMVLANGYTSAFGLLISIVTKGFWNHFMWLRRPDQFASQWWWYRIFSVDSFKKHSLKLFYNPNWTDDQKAAITQFIDARLEKGKWETAYDIIGVVGEFLGVRWLNLKKHDFCSEAISPLLLVDPEAMEWAKWCPHPTPEQVNDWLKSQKNPDGTARYVVYGRVQPE